jgi:hypothetical protein
LNIVNNTQSGRSLRYRKSHKGRDFPVQLPIKEGYPSLLRSTLNLSLLCRNFFCRVWDKNFPKKVFCSFDFLLPPLFVSIICKHCLESTKIGVGYGIDCDVFNSGFSFLACPGIIL